MWDTTSILPERPYHVTREVYDRMVEAGVLEDERVELLDGVIVEMSPQSAAHAYVISQLLRLLQPLNERQRALVRSQMPIALSPDSEPEPDVSVVPWAEYRQEHPSQTFLIVEVASSSQRKDLGMKAKLYAGADQPEYWVVDLRRGQVLVHRRPQQDGYAETRTYSRGESVAPLAFSDLLIPVDAILP